jgi:cytoskeletal protein CcmA (bactofilin family)
MFNKKGSSIEKELQKAEGETISAIIDKTMVISGEIAFKGKTRIDGTINGDITGEHLILSESGKITGDLNVSSFICHGTIEGNIIASLVTARKGCSIRGRLEAGSLTVEPGARLDGEVKTAGSGSVKGDAKNTSEPSATPPAKSS